MSPVGGGVAETSFERANRLADEAKRAKQQQAAGWWRDPEKWIPDPSPAEPDRPTERAVIRRLCVEANGYNPTGDYLEDALTRLIVHLLSEMGREGVDRVECVV